MRRTTDLLAAAAAAILLLPATVVLALLVRWRLGASVLFRQPRIGLDGREFTITKFRTMRPPRFAGEGDLDRGTPLGNVLRRTSLDELPQLWNVLRGEMSIIGPRPTLPEQVVHYSERQRGRHAVRPGLTGWAQVHGRNSISWPERIELDLWYIEHRCLRVDLRILWLTVLRLVRPGDITGDGGVNPGFPVAPVEVPMPSAGAESRVDIIRTDHMRGQTCEEHRSGRSRSYHQQFGGS